MIVEAMTRATWTDERMDDLNGRVDELARRMDQQFARIDRQFERVDRRFESIEGRLERMTVRILPAAFDAAAGRRHDRHRRRRFRGLDRDPALSALKRPLSRNGWGNFPPLEPF
jgi:hypothetical protein